MPITEYAVAAFFVAVALFGVVDAIRTPLVIKRYYRDQSFVSNGKKVLSENSDARVLDGMYTEHYYSQRTSGVSQFKSWSVDRRKFTLSKASRKRNRAPWSVTVVEGDFSKLSCLILPTIVPEAIAYIGNGENIDFESDLEIANRYHIATNREATVRSAITGEVRDFLLQPHVLFIEVTDKQLIMRRNWADHEILDRLKQELKIATQLKEQLIA